MRTIMNEVIGGIAKGGREWGSHEEERIKADSLEKQVPTSSALRAQEKQGDLPSALKVNTPV